MTAERSRTSAVKINRRCLHRGDGSARSHDDRRELFLVINRLEEFAGAVTEKLDTIDLETKRRIVLDLVKRVEIHKDEIVVVFRIDPQPRAFASENLNDSDDGVKSMQHRTRRTQSAIG